MSPSFNHPLYKTHKFSTIKIVETGYLIDLNFESGIIYWLLTETLKYCDTFQNIIFNN